VRPDFARRYSYVVVRPFAFGRFAPASIEHYAIEFEAWWSWDRPFLPRANAVGGAAVYFAAAAFALPGGAV
jgi:hypothetical protein